MGGITGQTAGSYGGYNSNDKKVESAQEMIELTESLSRWMQKQCEILGEMAEDKEFIDYVLDFDDTDKPQIKIDKFYLKEANKFVEAIRQKLDKEVIENIPDFEEDLSS